MKKYKIYGTPYVVMPTTKEPADSYAYRGKLVDDIPKGKVIGYVTMDDGSVIEVYKKFPIAVILVPLLLLILAVAAFLVYLLVAQPKDVAIGGDFIKIGDDNNIVTYNGVPSVRDGNLSIQYTNGDYPATIKVEGEGVVSQEVPVEAGQFIDVIPCKFTTEDGVVEATITVKTSTSTQSFPIVVEIPDNLNGNDVHGGQEGYWSGEQVYGP